jgi:hypothetical protein
VDGSGQRCVIARENEETCIARLVNHNQRSIGLLTMYVYIYIYIYISFFIYHTHLCLSFHIERPGSITTRDSRAVASPAPRLRLKHRSIASIIDRSSRNPARKIEAGGKPGRNGECRATIKASRPADSRAAQLENRAHTYASR